MKPVICAIIFATSIFIAVQYAKQPKPARSSLCPASVAKIRTVALDLPRGYLHRPAKGIDSLVGDIVIQNTRFSISYDSYGWGIPIKNLSDMHKDTLSSIRYYEKIQDAPPTCVYAWRHYNDSNLIVTLVVMDCGAHFNIQLGDNSDLYEAIKAVRAIKVIKN
jgi:hypothetical protein